MAWRRASGELLWHACSNCEEWPPDDAEFKEIAGDRSSLPGDPEENPVCERCDELLRTGAWEES